MARLSVDRLSLRVTGLGAEEGRRLARMVAERLGRAGGNPRGAVTVRRLRVTVTASNDAGTDFLSEQIAAEVLRELDRSVATGG